jgi:SAM-dependent methyltransferase
MTTAALYHDVWALPAYSDYSPGEQMVPVFLDMIGAERGSVLDAGCGSGKGLLALGAAGVGRLCGLDITGSGWTDEAESIGAFIPGDLRQPLLSVVGRVDWVYCCDVLEHVTTAFTMLVVEHLRQVARRGVFLSISFVPDHFGAFVGQPLHETIQPFTWWKKHLGQIATIREARDMITKGAFLIDSA